MDHHMEIQVTRTHTMTDMVAHTWKQASMGINTILKAIPGWGTRLMPRALDIAGRTVRGIQDMGEVMLG